MLIAFYTYRIPPRLQNRGADPLVRAGPPGPATSSLDEYQWQADVGVGRGPGGAAPLCVRVTFSESRSIEQHG
jgi:hypothetical protein